MTVTPRLSDWDPTPRFPSYVGPYHVGSTDVEVPVESLPDGIKNPDPDVSTIAFRVFYPCDAPSPDEKRPRPVYWISKPQTETLSGYMRFCGASSLTADFISMFPNVLKHVAMPVTRNARLADPPAGHDGRWPTALFSHGIAGSRNVYSHMCGSLASHGMVVLALEHRDGSNVVTRMRKTAANPRVGVIRYRDSPHMACCETYQSRDRQIRVRAWEACMALEAAHLIDAGREIDDLHIDKAGASAAKRVLAGFRDRLAIHEPGSVALTGHSFGCTAMVQLLKSAFHYRSLHKSHLFTVNDEAAQPAKIMSQVSTRTPLILFDPWGTPWNSPQTQELAEKPLPCFSADECKESDADTLLTVQSVPFFNWRMNLRSLRRILRDPRPGSRAAPHVFYPQSSAHLSPSDFGMLFPTLTRRLSGNKDPERTFDLNLRAAIEVLRRGVGAWASVAAHRDAGTSLGRDWRILAREADTVRGWVAVTFVDDDRLVLDDDRAGAGATQTDDVATTTDLTGEDHQTELGVEAVIKGAEGDGHKRRSGNTVPERRLLWRAASSGRVPVLPRRRSGDEEQTRRAKVRRVQSRRASPGKESAQRVKLQRAGSSGRVPVLARQWSGGVEQAQRISAAMLGRSG